MTKLYNDVDSLYDQPIIESDGAFFCPVCNKKYSRKKNLENHMAKKDCHTLVDLFQQTVSEEYMYDAYKSLIDAEIIKARNNINGFRKSRSYGAIAKVLVYWSKNKMRLNLFPFYIMFLVMKNRGDVLPLAISNGTKDDWLKSFRMYLILKRPDLIESDRFYHENEDRLKEDASFLIRSLERADITLDYIQSKIDVLSISHSITSKEMVRFEKFIDSLE